MTEKKRPRVIILESNEAILEKARNLLEKSGWDVRCEKTSIEALETAAHSKEAPFALFITDSKLPKMEGDEILKKVKTLSPFTQRMMMLPSDNSDILISAINKAKVNACITLPFKDNDFVSLAKDCFEKFRHAVKKEQLKRVTGHQNKQLYQAAQKLKKKDDGYKKQIEEKKTRILKLKSKARKLIKQHQLKAEIQLSNLIDKKEIPTVEDAFKNEFLFLCGLVKKEFLPFIKKHGIDPEILNLKSVISLINRIDNKTEEKPADTEEQQDQAPEENIPSDKPLPVTPVEQILKSVYIRVLQSKAAPAAPQAADATDTIVLETDEPDSGTPEQGSHVLDEHYTLSISEDHVLAAIKKKHPEKSAELNHTSAEILDYLRSKEVVFGILEDDAIETWLQKSTVDKIIIAKGDAYDPGENGKIEYHFETEFTNPGKINEDGTIDFRDRGETPFVKKGTLLATKTPARESKPGMSVSATPIIVEETIDPPLEAGQGTELSEDGLSIIASIDGQPHLDKLGTVSVSADLVIPGDVDFETGNINFQGNIIVKGLIKEGFKVKGINLTAQEIEGGIIDVTGDVNVSAGINESQISAQGNIYAKFINKSKIMGFGDLTVSKEIIDSTIHLSGQCLNETGQIIASQITAKQGISAGQIGTTGSGPSTFKVGMDEHIDILKKGVDEKLEGSVAKSKHIKDEIKRLEDEDQALYQQISEKAHTQDRAQLDIKEMVKELKALEEINDTAQVPLIKDEIKKYRKIASDAETELNAIFENQDKIANEIQKLKDQLTELEKENKVYVQEKKTLKEFAGKTNPVPQIIISKTIISGNIIKGPHSQMIINDDRSKCKIMEIGSKETGINIFEMIVTDL